MSGRLDNDVHTLDPAAVKTLTELLGGDREAVADLAGAFLEDGPQRLADARAGVMQGDLELAGRAAHTLKSNAMTFGASALASESRSLELAARDGDLAGSRALLGGLEAEWAKAADAIAALRDGAPR